MTLGNEIGSERDAVVVVASHAANEAPTLRCSSDEVLLGRAESNDVCLQHSGISRVQCKIHPSTFSVFNTGAATLHIEDEYGVVKHVLRRNMRANVRPMERFTLRFFPSGLRAAVEQVDVRLVAKDAATRLYESDPHPHSPAGLFVQTLKRKHAQALGVARSEKEQHEARIVELQQSVQSLKAEVLHLQQTVAQLKADGADDDATQVDSPECCGMFEDFEEGQPRSP